LPDFIWVVRDFALEKTASAKQQHSDFKKVYMTIKEKLEFFCEFFNYFLPLWVIRPWRTQFSRFTIH
jgi:hypothetical protein